MIRVLWLKTKSRKNIVCRLKLALKGMGRDGNDEIVLPAFLKVDPVELYVLNAQRNPQSPHEHLPQLKKTTYSLKKGLLEDWKNFFFDKWSLFVKKTFETFCWVVNFLPMNIYNLIHPRKHRP